MGHRIEGIKHQTDEFGRTELLLRDKKVTIYKVGFICQSTFTSNKCTSSIVTSRWTLKKNLIFDARLIIAYIIMSWARRAQYSPAEKIVEPIDVDW